MFAVHFYENKTKVLNQALRSIPTVDEAIKIKGRKGKVISVMEIDENTYHVYIEFEKIVDKNKASTKDLGKNKRR
ncbi:hypothetical protein [Psychrobacillus soli]|uniref:Uncharacterized protein n=1 Tax=Psychrobacillus soli TaxID=1543965 RepID=A0A544TKC5_9BACI|nr:hypothetical protein [Psychrobacillus soli]TQR17896.1 hypothetical protein FG383_03305 [Psychrobacillus soli]